MASNLRGKNRKGFTLIELMIVVVIVGVLAAIAIPNFLRFQAKSRQSEAKTNLGGIFIAQTSFFGTRGRYGTFQEIAWAPIGSSQRYTYYSGSGVAGGTSGTGDLVAAPPPVGLSPWVAVGGVDVGQTIPSAVAAGRFTAGAVGNIDVDVTTDVWAITERRALTNFQNDVTTP